MNILGILPIRHDTSVALVQDGRLISAVEEERFVRVKHTETFPTNSIIWTLAANNLKPSDIDAIAIPWELGLLRRSLVYSFPYILQFLRGKANLAKFAYSVYWALVGDRERHPALNKVSATCQILHYEHHLAHAASVYFTSGHDSAAILTVDGGGELDSTVIWRAGNGRIEPIYRKKFNESLGMFYDAGTMYLGFPNSIEDAGKTMGYAPYGKEESAAPYRRLSEILRVSDDDYKISGVSKSVAHAEEHLPYLRIMERMFGERFNSKPDPSDPKASGFAFAIQELLEDAMMALARRAKSETNSNHLLMAGGVALNAKANMAIRQSGLYDDVFIFPAPNDGGVAVGAAFLAAQELGDKPKNEALHHAYLGPKYSPHEIERQLDLLKVKYTKVTDVPDKICAKLENGDLVAYFEGSMELGPRALGHRSILADPRKLDMWTKVNIIKGRELWRPLAPSILIERTKEYYDDGSESPFMVMMYKGNELARKSAPAVTHIDDTARIQTVRRDVSPNYYSIISEFERRTGVPIVMNTSFNLAAELLINTPREAVRCFYTSGITTLILDDYMIQK
ncbi:MAG: hypothetical protein JRN15_05350 [Nitrososphaerota archaeon]|nr:hypothetical protein [Nitrososphaerota archaeon]